jgi:HEAT repeat protein
VGAVRALATSREVRAYVAIARAVNARDPAVRLAAAEVLEKCADTEFATAVAADPYSFIALSNALAGTDVRAAQAAALVLRRSETQEARDHLADVLRTGEPLTKTCIIWTQHYIATDDLVPDIALGLVDSDEKVRQAAHDALRDSLTANLAKVILHAAAATTEENAWDAIRCLTTSDHVVVSELVTALGDVDVRVRRVAARALKSAAGDVVVDALAGAVDDEDPKVGEAALQSLRYRREPRAVAALAQAVTSPDERVRSLAVDALSTRPLPGAIPGLAAAISGGDISARRSAVELLNAQLSPRAPDEWDSRAVTALAAATADPEPTIRLAAVRALRGATLEIAVKALLSSLADRDGAVRSEAAAALTGPHNTHVVEALLNVSHDDLPGVRAAALGTLRIPDRKNPAIIERARDALRDTYAEVRVAGCHLLKGTADISAISALVDVLTRDEDSAVRREAVSALAKRAKSHEDVVSELADVLARDEDDEVKLEAIRALTTSTVKTAPVALALAMRDPDAPTAEAAAHALSSSPRPESIGLLVSAMLHGERNVSQRALQALLESPRPNVQLCVIEAFPSRNPELRILALEGLVRRRVSAALPAIRQLVNDRDPQVSSLASIAPRYMRHGYALRQSQDHFELVKLPPSAGLPGPSVGLPGPSVSDVVDAFSSHTKVLSEQLPRRYVNVVITDVPAHSTLSRYAQLQLGNDYAVRIDVGPLSSDSTVDNAAEHPFPDSLIDTMAPNVEVIAVSDDYDIPKASHELTVPPHGRSAYVYIPARLKSRTSESARLRLLLYYKGNCLMSLVLWTGPAGNGYMTFVDYALTADLSQAAALSPQALAFHTSLASDSAFRLIAHSSDNDLFSADLPPEQVGAAADAARNTLLDVHFDVVNARSRYRQDNSKSPIDCKRDLAALAQCGWTLYSSIMTKRARRREFSQLLRNTSVMLGTPARVQVCIAADGRPASFPWQLIYDIPCTGGPPVFHDCPTLDAWLSGDAEDIPSICPHPHRRNTLCPFGFWGLAHELATPPSSDEHHRALVISSQDKPAQAIAALNRTLEARVTNQHVQGLSRLFRLSEIDDLETLEQALATDDTDLVYFYCHGKRRPFGRKTWKPVLEIGRGQQIIPEDLEAWATGWSDEHWQDPRPLVVLNGCHTSELTPEMLVDWVTMFEQLRAAGSVGTEVALTQPVATEAMECFLTLLANGQSAAASIRAMRWQLLAKGNVMGLAYTLYAYGGLTMRPHQKLTRSLA